MRGDTVRRPRKPWTPTVHALLEHLRSRGVPVPKPIHIDDEYEYVTVVPGTAGDVAWPARVSLDGLRSMGALLRGVHDASAGWAPPPAAVWSVPHSPGSIICHGDPKPANFAWSAGQAVGLYDWDAARPGEPHDDVAYGLLWTVPFEAAEQPEPAAEIRAKRQRAEAFLEGYGWREPLDVVDVAITRRAQAIDEVAWLGQHGHEPAATWLSEGWPQRWRDDIDALRSAGRRVFPDRREPSPPAR